MHKFSIAVIVGMFLLSACSSSGSGTANQAIQDAINAHLKNNPQLSLENFNTKIESVKIKGDTAEALARFVTKQPPHMAVEVHYQLKREGQAWKVVSSKMAGGQGTHGEAGGAMGGMGSGMGGGMGAGGNMGSTPPASSHGQSSGVPAPESSH